MPFSFGNYDGTCQGLAMVSCPLLGPNGTGLYPECYSRNIDINNNIIFQPATCLIHMAAIIMTFIMLWHVHSKYTAVGRKEILFFLYTYFLFFVPEGSGAQLAARPRLVFYKRPS